MIPQHAIEGTVDLPDAATFWTPKPSDIDEEGFGYFRGTWDIPRTRVADARAVIQLETEIAQMVDRMAITPRVALHSANTRITKSKSSVHPIASAS